ncbi:MAG TPA: glycosyltransferase family A protein [Caulobacteraceae bacterium]|nr:glycosyltransferase family A protein [Caulobacteraceae bacterium]
MTNADVTIVVPAYNAAGTVVETLRTVSAQTHRDLEIIVVDDGSSDDTSGVVEAYARTEPRLTLVRQENGGVASARNTGMRHARTPLIAPIDADDLWHPTKLEKHLAALKQDQDCAFVYSPFRILNGGGRMIGSHPFFAFSGRVFYRQLFFNMVGNGSGMTFRREVALAFGGYDESLREAGLQGCEDWLLQMLMSLDHPVAHVPEYLVGYRKVPGAMSSDTNRMWRSRIMAAEMIRGYAPPAARHFIDSAVLSFSARLGFQALRSTDARQLLDTIRVGVEKRLTGQLLGEVGESMVRAKRTRERRRPPGPKFLDLDPTVLPKDDFSPFTRNLIERLRAADEAAPLLEERADPGRRVSAG